MSTFALSTHALSVYSTKRRILRRVAASRKQQAAKEAVKLIVCSITSDTVLELKFALLTHVLVHPCLYSMICHTSDRCRGYEQARTWYLACAKPSSSRRRVSKHRPVSST